MLLNEAHNSLGWPSADQVLEPVGAGARVYADFAKQKIGVALRRKFPNLNVETGVLSADPSCESTEAPIAVVCEFPSGARDEELDEAHRLAWNFSRTALLVTLEPHRIIAWSCCQHPNQTLEERKVCTLPTAPGSGAAGSAQQRSLRDLLHWVGLVTGRILQEQPKKFSADGRADALLLKNLRVIRRRLLDEGLPQNFCHDLLARIIFTQFLFHRKDRNGRPFFDQPLLEGRCDGALLRVHDGLASILADKRETYALFGWLDDKFNGDLFPGKESQTDAERDRAWQEEKDAVTKDHLKLLADFVSGTLDTTDQQLLLWPCYAFDVIPLEFISSVYEEFLTEEQNRDKAYYTPAHLVDFVLDAVLPWKGEEWDLKILDPSCGSGIFLVKAFQRLIHRWRRKHPDEDPLVSHLKPILANNLIGVDKNPEAVRVACFSLYLAMADAIEPKYYLKREKVFPRLRGTRLLAQDFFDESTENIRTKEDADTFDFVLGNAPWGDGSIKDSSDASADAVTAGTAVNVSKKVKKSRTKAEVWAKTHEWPVANHDIGPLFLAKSAALVKGTGKVAMIQPAPLLYQRAEPAREFRRKLFLSHTVDEVTNLSALRRELFANAIGPACVIVFGKQKPAPEQMLLYICPKPLRDKQATHRFVIEPQDVNQVTHQEAATEPVVWSALAIGGRRDLALVLRLSRLPTLNKLEAEGRVLSRLGVIPGNKQKVLDGRPIVRRRGDVFIETEDKLPDLREKPYFDAKRFPPDVFLELDSDSIPPWKDPRVAGSDSTDFEAFKNPQLLIKLSFNVKEGRFRAVRVRSSDPEWGVICKKTYLSVRDLSSDGRNIQTACLAYNSLLATYYLGVTSSRVGHYITETLTDELLDVPLPPTVESLASLDSFPAIDAEARRAFNLTQADWTLVEDFLDTTLRDALRKTPGPGYHPTGRAVSRSGDESELVSYARHFTRVVKSTFGKANHACATVFEEPLGSHRLPVRMAAIHLDWPGHEPLKVEQMEADSLMDKLQRLYTDSMERKTRAHSGAGLGFQRVAFLFHTHKEEHGRVRSLYIIKPDQKRYWTRSLALRDADQLSNAILKAAGRKPSVA